MKTTTQPNLNSVKTTLFIVITLLTMFNVINAAAQNRYRYSRKQKSDLYLGFGASFGVRTQKVTSQNFEEINGMAVVQEGGNGIATIGNRFVRARFETGFYYSSASTKHTTDLVQLASSINIYPVQLISKGEYRLAPYFIAGISRNVQKFHGFYHMDEPSSTPINYSVTIEPFVGKAVSTQAIFGAGLEYNLMDQNSFVHVFAQARYGKELSAKSSSLLDKTSISNQMMLSIGIIFGRHYY